MSVVRQYWSLTKPRVVALIVFTALVGMLLAIDGMPDAQQMKHGALGFLGIWLAASSAAAINQILDARIDAKMARTSWRPLVVGQLKPWQALVFALLLAALSMAVLVLWVNTITAVLTFASLIGYAVVYTVFLKRATPQNIVIGGVAGAAPPLLGWAAVTGMSGEWDWPYALLLVLIIFAWTPPHFWALAIFRRDDYARALVLAALSMTVLALWVNTITAVLTFASLIGYAVVYTVFLKRATPQNIVIGGVAGAAPPLLGWAAVTGMSGEWDWPYALLLVLIIFVWTPPHFWALAIFRRDDYARALVPMLPVTHGVTYTRWQILFYTVLLVEVTVLPVIFGMSGLFYLGGALVLGAVFLWYAWRLLDPPDEFFPMRVFNYSIVYLMALFVFLLADHWLMPLLQPATLV